MTEKPDLEAAHRVALSLLDAIKPFALRMYSPVEELGPYRKAYDAYRRAITELGIKEEAE